MTQAEQRDPAVDNPVSSFETGLITLQGAWIGLCIKFAMFDRSTRLTHWSPKASHALIAGLTEYCNNLGSQAFMFRANADPSLTEGLNPRHPFHTLLSEQPTLSEDEIGTAGLKTGINEAEFVSRGPTFEVRPVYGNGRRESIFLHEYTALSLLGYLQEVMKAVQVLIGPTAGSA
jgi:hypothetical protein